MLSIHINLSAGAQNSILRNNYACLQALVNNALSCQPHFRQQLIIIFCPEMDDYYDLLC